MAYLAGRGVGKGVYTILTVVQICIHSRPEIPTEPERLVCTLMPEDDDQQQHAANPIANSTRVCVAIQAVACRPHEDVRQTETSD